MAAAMQTKFDKREKNAFKVGIDSIANNLYSLIGC